MLNFIVLGIVPGTSIELTLNWLLVIFSIVGFGLFLRNEVKNRRIKKSKATTETINQLA
jgi:hypothetical protein